MRIRSWAASGVVVAPAMVMVLSAPIVTAQTPPAHSTNSFTVTASKPVKMLFALTAAKGSVTPVSGKKRTYVLTLRRVSDQVTWFSDRPVRDAGLVQTSEFIQNWATTSFEQDPPNVALVAQDLDGATFTTVAVMSQPRITATGVFTARLRVLSMEQVKDIDAPLLAGHITRHSTSLPQRFTTSAVFIDDVVPPVTYPYTGYWHGPSNPYN